MRRSSIDPSAAGDSVKATMLLADFAQASDEGKLTLVGAGWTVTPGGVQAVPFGLGILVEVPWDRSNERHTWVLELMDEDGQPVMHAPQGQAELPFRIEGDLEVGRPPGIPPGTALQAALAINSPPLQLPAEQGYSWTLSLNGEEVDRCTFRTVRPR